MNKRKPLFAPEDFDKEPKSSAASKTKKWLLGGVAAVVVVACVIGFVQLNPSASNGEENGSVAVHVDSATAERTDSVQVAQNQAEADTASASTGENAVEAEIAKAEKATTAETETPAASYQKSSLATVAASDSQATGSIEDEARQVIRGTYGNGSERKQKLGSRYSEIQSMVNDMYRKGQVY